VLLSGRTHLGAAGVICVTPLVLANGERILVERGWLEAADSRTALPPLEDTARIEVVGVVQPYGQPAIATPWVRLPSDSAGVALWSARALVADEARGALGSPLAGWVLRMLPGPEDASHGRDRPVPEPFVIEDASMHLSYAIQWFAFAAIVLLGSLALARRRT
jgi:cytochrome oxidase assembly protein ShyY1